MQITTKLEKIIAVLTFVLFVAFAMLSIGAKPTFARCVYSCDYGSWSCGTCSNCSKTCTRWYCCTYVNCSEDCGTQTTTQSCESGYTDCEACDCSGHKTCYNCAESSKVFTCARPAGCYIPTPTPTPTAGPGTCGYEGDCITDADCPNDPTDGDTCIVTKNPGECWCTKETNPSTYECVPYRDCYYFDGQWYQQWKCCQPTQEDCSTFFYQIRQTCEGVTSPSPTSTSNPSCSVSLSPSSASITVGSGVSLVAKVTPSDGTVDRVSFSTNDSSVASVDPLVDSTTDYSTAATGVTTGNVTITAQVTMDGSVRCSDSSTVSVGAPGPWWQTEDADITANGELVSLIPSVCSLPVCDPVLGIAGEGGFPGIPSLVGAMNLGSHGSVSSTGWSAESGPGSRRNYSYSHFIRQIPSDVEFTEVQSSVVGGSLFESGGILSRGAFWYRYDGSSGIGLTVSGNANVGSRKVILLVADSNLYLNGKINLDDGGGFFAAIVGRDSDGNGGNITVGPSVGGAADGVPELEGLFVADSEFGTGAGSSQLHVRGSVAGLSGVVLGRDLDDDSQTPAEYFEYAPDLILNIPSSLKMSRYDWLEVAP